MSAADQQARVRGEEGAEGALQRLLRAERPAFKRPAAQRIAGTDLSVAMKIERLRAIDAQEDPAQIGEIVRQATAQAARLRAARVQRTLKKPQQSCSYFRFLLHERRRLQDFARQTHVLEVSVLPPGVRPAQGLRSFFLQSLQPWAAELVPQLKKILEHAWLYLSPYQYNLLALVAKLAERILAFDFLRLDYRSPRLIDALQRIERPFLTLVGRDEHLPTITAALQTVCEKTHRPQEQAAELRGLVERLLFPEAALPSLHNVVLGLNSVKNRRLSLLGDLLKPELSGLVNSRDFDCAAPQRKRIDGYVRESLDSVRALHRQLFEARRLESHVRRGPEGEADTAGLAVFYAGGSRGRDLLADQADTVRLVSHLCARFERVFLPLLAGRIRLVGGGRGSVFSRSFFEEDLLRLRALADALDKGPFHFSSFPLERYLRIKGGSLAAIGAESEAARLVDEAAERLVDVGRTISRVLSLRSPGTAPAGAAEPLNPVILQGKSFVLPMENETIAAPAELQNSTVVGALAQAAELCFAAGLLLRDNFLGAHLSRLRKTEVDLSNRLRLLENLMVPEDYRELAEKLR